MSVHEKPNIKTIEQKEDFSDYCILAVGEGGGEMGRHDRSVFDIYGSVRDKIKKGAKYISTDSIRKNYYLKSYTEKELLSGRDKIINDWNNFSENPKRVFLNEDANSLSLPDNSINEVWAENVFGDPSANSGVSTLYELNRVMAVGGELYILEQYTPENADYIKSLLAERLGFSLKVYEGEGLKKFLLEDLKMHPVFLSQFSPSVDKDFIVVLTKTRDIMPAWSEWQNVKKINL